MIFKEKPSLLDINENGFIFHRFNFNDLFDNNLTTMVSNYSRYISNLIAIKDEELFHDIDCINPGEEIQPHFHVVEGSFQVVVWIDCIDFKGRDFLYGKSIDLKSYHPERGVMCFMKPNDPMFFHGVSKLLSKDPIRTLGFSSLKGFDSVAKQRDVFLDRD